MHLDAAKNLIRDTFQNQFDESRFRVFIKNLFNDIDESKAFSYQGQYVPDAYKDHIRQYKRLGKFTDPEGYELDVLVVNLKKEAALDRARTMQRNFIAWYLKHRGEKEAAIVAYHTDGLDDWRFSYVRMDYRTELDERGKVKIQTDLTPARRYSFLVGNNEPNHTAQQQLLPILQEEKHNPTLAELEKAFNIESITKEFFERYKNLFLKVKEELDALVECDKKIREDFAVKNINTADFAKKLLGQIVFLYFLQKKGWLGVEKDSSGSFKGWGTGPKDFLQRLYRKEIVPYDNFFNDLLEPLFYEALAIDRGEESYYSPFKCKIPFLNGGLFEPISGYNWQETDILIKNETIGDVFSTFDLYNFTVREDEPLEKEVAVDPEMLGKVFENLLEVKDRKSKGAFYTPREIVHYMCQESLINYLDGSLNADCIGYERLGSQQNELFGPKDIAKSKGQMELMAECGPTPIPREDIVFFIRHGEFGIENDLKVEQKGRETKDYTYKLPESVRTNAGRIDEALADIKICDPAIGSGAFPVGMLHEIVSARKTLNAYLGETTERTPYNFKRHAIQQSIYGVDIDCGAVDIAKLRLWLSLVVDEDDFKTIKPLPNLDYKIVCGNSLLKVERNLLNDHLFQELEDLKQRYFDEINPRQKKEEKARIQQLIRQLTNNDEHFDYEIYFSEVFHEKGGFDIVIANPPYIGQKNNNVLFQEIKKSPLGKYHQRRMDYFYFFFHAALDITRDKGIVAYITTNYFLTATYADKLRKDFKTRATLKILINFNELKIFESAVGQHNIITILSKGSSGTSQVKCSFVTEKGVASGTNIQSILYQASKNVIQTITTNNDIYEGDSLYIRMHVSDSEIEGSEDLFKKITSDCQWLGDICDLVEGIHTGADKISESHLEKYKLTMPKGTGIFVLSKNELNKLVINDEEKELIKPWFKNSDIKKWVASKDTNKSLIYYTTKGNYQSVDNLRRYLSQFKAILINRKTRSGTGLISINDYDDFVAGKKFISYVMNASAFKRGDYYCISYPREQHVFEGAKIIVPQRSSKNTFAYNELRWYASADVYFIIKKHNDYDLKFILGLLNSELIYYWLYHKGKRKGETLELYIRPLSEIPIKCVAPAEQKPIIDLVDSILALKNKDENANVTKLERDINKLVYDLYGLCDDEIVAIEGSISD